MNLTWTSTYKNVSIHVYLFSFLQAILCNEDSGEKYSSQPYFYDMAKVPTKELFQQILHLLSSLNTSHFSF